MSANPIYLGVEGGATRTVALFANARGRVLRRVESGPLNLKLATDRQVLGVLKSLTRSGAKRQKPEIVAVALCLAGCRTEADRARLRRLARRVWPRARCLAGNDLDSGFAASFGPDGNGIYVISGTGSCVFGRRGPRAVKVGGWGHLLGDHSSGYWIALHTLRFAIHEYDHTGRLNRALRKTLRFLRLPSLEQLVDWIHSASKSDVAALAAVLLGEEPRIVRQAAAHLALDCRAVARQLRLPAPAVVLSGGVFAHHPKFFLLTARQVRQCLPRARVLRPPRESAHGALLLALRPT